MKRTLLFLAALGISAMASAESRAGPICVKSRLDKGAWFVAKVDTKNTGWSATNSHEMSLLAAGQEKCSVESSTWANISIEGAESELELKDAGKCRIEIWGTTLIVYFTRDGDCGTTVKQHYFYEGKP